MRRFIRFSVRDLFWLTLVVAMGVAWWTSYQTVRHHRLEVSRVRGDAMMIQLETEAVWRNYLLDILNGRIAVNASAPSAPPGGQSN